MTSPDQCTQTTTSMMATLSSRNPFRSLDPTPATSPTSPVSAPVLPPRSLSPPPPEPTVNTPADSAVDSTGLSDELPPAYTPAPDTRQGESTVEYGPRRPFQSPPQNPNPPHRSRGPPPTLWSQLTGIPTGNSWSSYPGRQNRPVQHHASQSSSHLQVPRPPSPAPTATSEFARDFYAAGSSESNLTHSAPSSPGSYAPPPGPPPSSTAQPTSTPKPGHPLLRDGKLLVYPKGYQCSKCMNLGYKRMDPSHPCKRCWGKFAKLFQGPLVTAYSNQSSTTSPDSASSSFQRPLPDFRPPQRAPRPQSFPPAPPPPPPPQQQVPVARNQNVQIRALSPYAPPPPSNAVVYRSGDPRLGGRLCWRCDGTGSISLFLIDTTTCFECGGVGRLFR